MIEERSLIVIMSTTASLSRTAVNIQAGGNTMLTGLINVVLVALSLLVLTGIGLLHWFDFFMLILSIRYSLFLAELPSGFDCGRSCH